MQVVAIPCLQDNFAYLIICERTNSAGVVDPSEAAPVLQEVERTGVKLKAILNTHHHWDHTGGNADLLARHPGLEVYGHRSDRDRIEGQTKEVHTGDRFMLGQLDVSVLHNPGHTSGGVSYVVDGAVFTGDTLFAAGCGRFFEGTPADMHRSLVQVLGGLPERTKIYFGHEYTEANLRFAASVEPDNEDVQQRLQQVRELRAKGGITTPSTLAEEWRTNPFMRLDSPTIHAIVRKHDPDNDLSPVSVMAAVREMKNKF